MACQHADLVTSRDIPQRHLTARLDFHVLERFLRIRRFRILLLILLRSRIHHRSQVEVRL
jgi:hypothetical protein